MIVKTKVGKAGSQIAQLHQTRHDYIAAHGDKAISSEYEI